MHVESYGHNGEAMVTIQLALSLLQARELYTKLHYKLLKHLPEIEKIPLTTEGESGILVDEQAVPAAHR